MLSDQSLAFARAFVPRVLFISLSLDTLCRLYPALLRYLRSTISGPYLLNFFCVSLECAVGCFYILGWYFFHDCSS